MSRQTAGETILDYPREVTDEAGFVHRLEPKPLGIGGQGAVFRTTERDLAVKFATDSLGRPVREGTLRDGLYRQLEQVRTLPLPELKIAQPLQLLARPYAGYVMRLLTDMKPLRKLLAPPGASLAKHFLEDGGLRRRLVLLGSIAEVLARLHAVPVVYADVSPNNIFVSDKPPAAEVWLIDSDNLHFLSRSGGPAIYTPGFGAPELVQGRSGATTLTDIHAFAVLAFQVLAQQHPFIGELVEMGGWDSDEDMEEKAFRGELPWIDDPDDESNRTGNGIPRELILNKPLRDLFQQTFGPGRTEPTARPGLLQWAEALSQAADLTLLCPECQSSYYVMKAKQCPWCDAVRPPILYIEARCWDPELEADEFDVAGGGKVLGTPVPADSGAGKPWRARALWHKVIVVGRNDTIGRQMIAPTLFRDGEATALSVEFGQHTVSILPREGGPYMVVGPKRNATPLKDLPSLRLKDLNAGWHLHCGPLDQPHRVLSLAYFGRPSA